MECQEVQARLVRYADNDLPPEHRRAVEAHLEHCYHCGEELDALVSLLDASRDALRCPEVRYRFEALRPRLHVAAPVPAVYPWRQIVAGWAAVAAVALLIISTAPTVARTIRGVSALVQQASDPDALIKAMPDAQAITETASGPDTEDMPLLMAWQTKVRWAESLDGAGHRMEPERAPRKVPAAEDDSGGDAPAPMSLREWEMPFVAGDERPA